MGQGEGWRAGGGKAEIKLGYINIQGGIRKKEEQLREFMVSEEVDILGVGETHV